MNAPLQPPDKRPAVTCEDVRPYLEQYWTKTDSLPVDRQLRIHLHLQDCTECQTAFSDIMRTRTPPWKT